jgi:hypothetical protein
MNILTEEQSMILDVLNESPNWNYNRYKNLTEEAKVEVNDKVVTALFKDIKNKAFKLDFSIFDNSKGDITKTDCYETVANALKFLNSLSKDVNNKELKQYIQTIETALSNLEKNKANFGKAYSAQNRLLEYLYGSTGIAIIASTSYLVSVCVEVIKNPKNGFYECTIDETTKIGKNCNLESLKKFNTMCANGQLTMAFSKLLKVKNESIYVTVGTTLGIIMLIILLIREVVFGYYYIRVSISSYLEQLSKFILLNASKVTDSNVKSKQENIAKRLYTLSQKIAVDQKVATDRADDESKKSDKSAGDNTTSNDSGTSDDSGIDDIL